MFGIKKIEDFNILNKKELIQICFGCHQVILNFSDEISLSLECDFELVIKNQNIKMSSENVKNNKELIELLGEKISYVSTQDNRILILEFSAEHKLRLIDSNEKFESFQLQSHEKLIVV